MQDGMFVQCGREITAKEIGTIRSTVTDLWGLSRSDIIEAVCEELQWFAATGAYKVEACTKLLLKLESRGILKLPERRNSGGSPHHRRRTPLAEAPLAPEVEITGKVRDIGPVRIEVVEGAREEEDWNALVCRYHYLGYRKPIGCFLRYVISAPGAGILGCALFAGAARAISIRDAWIGWNPGQRLRNLGWVINNTRLLFLPWVRVKCLASHVLGQLERRVAKDWEARWGYRPVLMESFVDPGAFRGTCYKAANWQHLGNTTGEGLARRGKQYQTTAKMLFVRPLATDFRAQLCSNQLTGRGLQ